MNVPVPHANSTVNAQVCQALKPSTANPTLLKAMGIGFVVTPKEKEPSMAAGRLASFIDTWKVLTKDTWVLNAIEGYQISLVGIPTQFQRGALQRAQSSIIGGDTGTPTQRNATGFISILFLVAKRNRQMRPVINLKQLNHWIEAPHFKMEEIPTLRDMLHPGDWIIKVDLKDAYFTIHIHQDHQQYLRFMVDEIYYQFTCLPFGLSCAHGPSPR